MGALLGLDPRYVADVKALTDYAAAQDFSHHVVEHWHLGRQMLGVDTPLEQKLQTGMDAHITRSIHDYREQVHHHYEVPAPIMKEEQRVAQALDLLDPIQRVMLHRLGYEICYSPEMTADDIAFYKGIYGLHRKAANNLRDVKGTYRIYFSDRGDLKGSMRTLVHEAAHNLWPDQFTPQQAAQVDALARSDQERFGQLQQVMSDHFVQFERLLNAYHAGDAQEKAAVITAANQQFAPYGVTVDGLFPYLKEAHQFQFMVKHALNTLSVEGDRYHRSGYNSPEERFREVISRYAELRQVEHRAEPALLDYLAPGMNRIWTQYYIPHLEHVYASIGPEHPTHLPHSEAAPVSVPLSAAPVAPEPISAPVSTTAPEPASTSTPVPVTAPVSAVTQDQPKLEQRPGDGKPVAVAPILVIEPSQPAEQQPKVEQRPVNPPPVTTASPPAVPVAPAPAAPPSPAVEASPRVKEQVSASTSVTVPVTGSSCHGECGGTCAVHRSTPATSVDTMGMNHERMAAALNALHAMGVDSSLR